MNRKVKIGIIVGVLLVVLFGGVFFYQKSLKKEKTSTIDAGIDMNHDDEDIDWGKYEVQELVLSENDVITKEGVYHVTGSIKNGCLKVNTNGNVKLIFDNVEIMNESGPALYVENAKNILIYLEENSKNVLTDGTKYNSSYEDIDATIYSKDDLIFDGTGSLIVHANYQDGIVSKDDLKFLNGSYEITSNDDGIRGRDSVYIKNGDFTIQSSGDGIKSTNDTNDDKGYILIENGKFNQAAAW